VERTTTTALLSSQGSFSRNKFVNSIACPKENVVQGESETFLVFYRENVVQGELETFLVLFGENVVQGESETFLVFFGEHGCKQLYDIVWNIDMWGILKTTL
jgi:hypothetical protein